MRVASVLAGQSYEGLDHMNGWGGGWMWLWGVAMMTMFFALAVWLVRSGASGAGDADAASVPRHRGREILAERYARGELSTEEYKERSLHLE